MAIVEKLYNMNRLVSCINIIYVNGEAPLCKTALSPNIIHPHKVKNRRFTAKEGRSLKTYAIQVRQ